MNKWEVSLLIFFVLIFNTVKGDVKLQTKEILRKVDSVMNAPRDQYMKLNMTLIDRKGNKSIREIEIYQKGKDRRLGKFTFPAEYKGIGFLSLPKGVFYIYLPAFNKIKRISSNVKNAKFAGTDFTYEDMEPKNYEENWDDVLVRSDSQTYEIKITPKKGIKSYYKYEILTINKGNFFPIKSAYYKGDNQLVKVMTADSLVRLKGYWIAVVSTMKDIKSGHTSVMKLEDIKLNTGLSDNVFTKRYLKQ